MNVLFLTAMLPYPPSSGATTRTYQLLRRIARAHAIHLVAYGDPARDARAREVFAQWCASVTIVPRQERKRGVTFYGGLLANLLSPYPFSVSRFTSTAMTRAVARVAESHPIDLIQCDFLSVSRHLASIGHPADGQARTPRVLTAHNVESVIWRRYLSYERNPLRSAYTLLQARKMERFESRTLAGFDHVVTVSAEDMGRLRHLCPTPAYSVVPNGVDLDYFRPSGPPRRPHGLVFTGSMDWRPNQDAIRFFLAEIYPKIKQAEPGVSLTVVGREPPESLRDVAATHPHVTITGTVPDVRPYLSEAAVYVVPLRIGGGTRLKILEAMAARRPVVSTAVGCEGLGLHPGRDLLVADTPPEFATAVLGLIRNPTWASDLAAAGRSVVEAAYSWDRVADSLAASWEAARCTAGRGAGMTCAALA